MIDHTLRSDVHSPVLHFTEGQKNEKSGSVVNHCWLWLQVIKALLSFCQSSDSTNISPWLISAVFSVQFIPSPERLNTQPVFTVYVCIPEYHPFGQLSVHHHRHMIIAYIQEVCELSSKWASLRVENLLQSLMGIFWFYQVVLQLKLLQFLFSWMNSLNAELQSSYIIRLSFVKISLPLVHPMNEDGHLNVW